MIFFLEMSYHYFSGEKKFKAVTVIAKYFAKAGAVTPYKNVIL